MKQDEWASSAYQLYNGKFLNFETILPSERVCQQNSS